MLLTVQRQLIRQLSRSVVICSDESVSRSADRSIVASLCGRLTHGPRARLRRGFHCCCRSQDEGDERNPTPSVPDVPGIEVEDKADAAVSKSDTSQPKKRWKEGTKNKKQLAKQQAAARSQQGGAIEHPTDQDAQSEAGGDTSKAEQLAVVGTETEPLPGQADSGQEVANAASGTVIDLGAMSDAVAQSDSGAEGEDSGQEAAANGDATVDSGAVDAAGVVGVGGTPGGDSDKSAIPDGGAAVPREEAIAGGNSAAGNQEDSDADALGEDNAKEDGVVRAAMASAAEAALAASEGSGAARSGDGDASMTDAAEAGSQETVEGIATDGSTGEAAQAQPATQLMEAEQALVAADAAGAVITDDVGLAGTAVDTADTHAQSAVVTASGETASAAAADVSLEAASVRQPTAETGSIVTGGGAVGLHLAAERATDSNGGFTSASDDEGASAQASSGAGDTAASVAATATGTQSSIASTVSCQRWTPAGCSLVPGQVRAALAILRHHNCALQGCTKVMAGALSLSWN